MLLLSEKYRPKELSEVIGNNEVIEILQRILDTGNTPHLLFTGPPGTGKTTSAWILSKKLLPESQVKDNVLELNASDERGIDVVRTKIKNFSQKISLDVPYKIIILDEADSMTSSAQQAMRRTMETCKSTRFILICNTLSKIFEPIQSRCAILKFERISQQMMINRIWEVVRNENININEDGVKMIVDLADCDMRQAFNILQCTLNAKFVNESVILKVTGQPSPKLVEKVFNSLNEGDIEMALKIFDGIWSEKYDSADIINSFFKVAKNRNDLEALKCIGVLQVRIAEGLSSKLQFYGMFYDLLRNKQY